MGRKLLLLLLCLSISSFTSAQNFFENSSVSGSIQSDAQFYFKDNALGIDSASIAGKRFGMNSFGQLNYNVGNFTAGVRFEAYTPQLNGFSPKAKGYGIPFFFASYANKYIDATVGDFYEQFGSGLVLRSYQEWNLGYDNAIRGAKVSIMPYKGIRITGLTGFHRWFWNNPINWQNIDRGRVSGVDGNFSVNDIFGLQTETQISIGGSFASKNEQDIVVSKTIDSVKYVLNLPENVGAFSGRMNLSYKGFSLFGEYAHKVNNPSNYNNYIYKPGQALYLTASYSQKGLGITVSAKRVDNMSFKSNINTTDNALDINFIPPLGIQSAYSLPSLYPYSTQLNGETSLKANVIYSVPKNTWLGGKYGMSIEADFTIAYDIKKVAVDDNTAIDEWGTLGYKSSFFAVGNNNLYRDAHLIVTKKFSKEWKGVFTYMNLLYDKDRVEGKPIGDYGVVISNVVIADATWKINSKHSLRAEVQALFTMQDSTYNKKRGDVIVKKDRGDWLALTLEYTITPHWFFTVMDEYNFGNPEKDQKLHYYNISTGYMYKTTRVALSYGRQREGLLCIGGVCRYVPASSGLSVSISSSF